MSSETVEVETADGVADAYLSRPEGQKPHSGVLLLMDAFGLRSTIEELADRIAARGYVVLAPNLFYRAGSAPVTQMPNLEDPDARGAFMAKLRPLMDDLTPERIATDGDAYLKLLESQTEGGPITITGYCLGVRVGWRIIAAHPGRVVALGGFHGGGLVTDAPDTPHRIAGELDAELYLAFADDDPSMTAENIAELERALDEAGVKYRAEVYEGAGHGYTMSDTPVYDEQADKRHFEELFALLERAGGERDTTD